MKQRPALRESTDVAASLTRLADALAC
ncbi:DNA-binding transcriptional regulator, partial [Xanthomonas oryzae pv. oryzae]